MSELLEVFLYDYRVGTLRRDDFARYVFEYDDDWSRSDDTTPLSLSMPLPQKQYSGGVVANFLDNLLPDNPEVRQRWATDAGLDTDESFFLLRHYGQDVAGAVSFRSPDAPRQSRRQAVSPGQIADRIRRLSDDETAWHDDRIAVNGQFSLGGAQSKFSLARSGEQWFETWGADPSTHVFKPRVKGVVDGELIEYVVMRAASALGVPAAAVDLFIEGDQHSLVVARFDRRVEAGGTSRIHQEDLLQSLGLPRLRKFESLGGPGIEQVMRLLARSSDGQSRARYAVQLMFAWIVLSTDAHAKNYSLFLQPDGALLTPMYDASSVIPYLGPDRDTDNGSILRRAEDCSLAVKYGASYSARDVARFELDVIARAAGMPGDDLLALVANCLIDISHTVSDVASALPVGLQTDTVARLVEWMPLRAKQAARALDIGDLI